MTGAAGVPLLVLMLGVLLSTGAGATLFPYQLVDAGGVPSGRCASGDAPSAVWPAGAGACHDDAATPCVADPPNDVAESGLHESIMCAHVADATPDGLPVGLCDMATSTAGALCTTENQDSVCGAQGSCSTGGCQFVGGQVDCSGACVPFVGDDVDCDGTPNQSDGCPWYPSTLDSATIPIVDADGRAPDCRCGDMTVDASIDIQDILAINSAIFQIIEPHPLCDANNDQNCDIIDILGVNSAIFTPGTTICNRHPQPAP